MSTPLRLLQVEDSPSDAALIVRLLEKAGHDVESERVETAPQMQAALEKQAWDMIIADYHLPGFDAPTALRVLRGSGLDLPFIVVSGAVGEDLAVAMMKAGAQDYLMKSNLTRLAPAVDREIHEAQIRRERKLADRLLDAVFTAQPDAVLVYNTDGAVIRANPAAAQMQLPAEIAASTRRALMGETVSHIEEQAADRTFETFSAPMRDSADRIIGAVTMVRDITEKKRADEHLRSAQKLECIATLAGGIAHDFNNILTVVSGNISLALEDSCPGCSPNSVLPDALESLQRAAGLTRQLLAYAGKGCFQRKPVAISSVAEQVVAGLLPALPSRIRLLTYLAPALPPLLMDPGQMEQVFSNLILNAVEAIPDGQSGVVTVRTGLQGDFLRIEVSDNGCGIDAETRKRIFDPFFTTRFPGRGLGLAAVEGIVRALDGKIMVHSTVGIGTCFTLFLPLPNSVQDAVPSAAPRKDSANLYGTVLIVDDEPMVRKMARAFLKKHGIPVLEAANGKEAIERLTREGDDVRAILLDVAMPEMSGDAALPGIRKLRPDVQVIVSSGFQDHEVKQRFSHIGGCRFLPKPYTPEQLFAEILPAVSRPERST